MTENHIHRFYFVKFRPSPEEVEKEEDCKQYQLMTIDRSRISEEIAQQKVTVYFIVPKLFMQSFIRKEISCVLFCFPVAILVNR